MVVSLMVMNPMVSQSVKKSSEQQIQEKEGDVMSG